MKHSKLLVLKVSAMLITVALMFSMAASCASGPSPEELAAYKEREAAAKREEDRAWAKEALWLTAIFRHDAVRGWAIELMNAIV
jgi:hypothetical protein